jgi:hypothetical protein
MSTMSNAQSVVRSYLFLRKGIGSIGLALPFVLVLGKLVLDPPGISDSISAYYYTVMRNVFVGSLWAVAIFLICYRYHWLDDLLSTVAGCCAIGVSIFPAAPPVNPTAQEMLIGSLHLVFAMCFFFLLAFFALVLFRKMDQSIPATQRKRQRNAIYLVCGIAIVICIVLIFVAQRLAGISWLQPLHPVFWLESLALLAFGVAWFVKGETILQDI